MKIGQVLSISKSGSHTLYKTTTQTIHLFEGLGVDGDAHMGETVKHRSRVAKDPTQPNLRQVHLIHSELFSELATKGFTIGPGEMGENITTSNIDLLNLPSGTILTIGETSRIQITGLRNPCHQLNGIQDGLMNALVFRNTNDQIIRKAGVMGIVLTSGEVSVGNQIQIEYPPKPFIPLDRV